MSRVLIRGYSNGPTISVADLLRYALANLSDPSKWYKGDFYGDDGGSCALGAISLVATQREYRVDMKSYLDAEQKLVDNLKARHPELTADTIPDLNDDPAVTYEDVVSAFKDTIAQLEGQESGSVQL